jgi:hypothetical protein
MTQPDTPLDPVEALLGDPVLYRIHRAGLELYEIPGIPPEVKVQLSRLRQKWIFAAYNPGLISLRDRFDIASYLHQVAPEIGKFELRGLAAAIADDALEVIVSHAAEAATLLADLQEVERTRRFLELLAARVAESPPPARVPVDLPLAASLYDKARALFAPWRTGSGAERG